MVCLKKNNFVSPCRLKAMPSNGYFNTSFGKEIVCYANNSVTSPVESVSITSIGPTLNEDLRCNDGKGFRR